MCNAKIKTNYFECALLTIIIIIILIPHALYVRSTVSVLLHRSSEKWEKTKTKIELNEFVRFGAVGKRKLFFMQKKKEMKMLFWLFCRIEITLTRCGAPNNLKIDPNCVANGAVYANEYVGALDGIGNIDAHSYGSLSAKYWTRIGTSSSGSILRIIFFCFCVEHRIWFFYFGCNLSVRSGLIWSKATSFIFGRNGHGSTPLLFVRAHSIIGDADRINHCVESVVFTSFVKVLGPRNDIVKDNIKLQINY